MSIPDFTALNGEQFEDLCEDLFKAMGFIDPPPERSGRGPDAGRDLIVTEQRVSSVSGVARSFRWLVQCKNFAISDRSVQPRDAGPIMDKLSRHEADGYLLLTSTIPSSDLEADIAAIDRDVRNTFEATYWAKSRLIDEIRKQRVVYEKYFGAVGLDVARPVHWSRRNPFMELFAYDEALAGYFFGREEDTSNLLELVYRRNIVLVYGESGVGKTSVLNAGVVPQLKNEGATILSIGVEPDFRWQDLLDSLRQVASTLPETESDTLDSIDELYEALARALRQREQRLVVLLDQFEVLLASEEASLIRIGSDLAKLVSVAKRFDSITFVVSLRSDYLDKLGIWAMECRIPDLWAQAYPLRNLSVTQVNEILAKVPPIVDARFSPEATLSIVTDLQEMNRGEIYPPDLQIVASRVFEQARSHANPDATELLIQQDDYEAVGTAKGILEAFLDDKLAGLGAEQEVAREVLLALVSATGRRLSLTTDAIAEQVSSDATSLRPTIDSLIDARLVRPAGHPDLFELVHDVLAVRVLEVTDDDQLKAKGVREAFYLALSTWQGEGVPESGRKLDWYYHYRQWLNIDVDALVFLLLSETSTVLERNPFPGFRGSRSGGTQQAKRRRWIDAADPEVSIQALDRILALRQAERVDENLTRDIVSDICSASRFEAQRELITKLESFDTQLENELFAQVYRGSAVPNQTTLSYLQDVVLSDRADEVKYIVAYRLLEHYRSTLPQFIDRRRPRSEVISQDWRGSFPTRLFEDTTFRDTVFRYLNNLPEWRRHRNSWTYRLELLEMLYQYVPNQAIETLWQQVSFDGFGIGLTSIEALQLLQHYDPERTVREVAQALSTKHFLHEEDISVLELLEVPDSDALLIGFVQRYVEEFNGGSKRWRGGYPPPRYWVQSVRRAIEIVQYRKLDAVLPYLTTIALRDEPANVKLDCVNAIMAIGSEEVWPILVTLLNDRSAQVRNLCAKYLSRMNEFGPQILREITRSFDEDTDSERPMLSNGHKDVMAVKIDLLRRLRDPNAIELLESIARSEKDTETKELAARVAVGLSKSTNRRRTPPHRLD